MPFPPASNDGISLSRFEKARRWWLNIAGQGRRRVAVKGNTLTTPRRWALRIHARCRPARFVREPRHRCPARGGHRSGRRRPAVCSGLRTDDACHARRIAGRHAFEASNGGRRGSERSNHAGARHMGSAYRSVRRSSGRTTRTRIARMDIAWRTGTVCCSALCENPRAGTATRAKKAARAAALLQHQLRQLAS
jgi:hypothetical protein